MNAPPIQNSAMPTCARRDRGARAGSESVPPTTRAHARAVVQLCGCEALGRCS